MIYREDIPRMTRTGSYEVDIPFTLLKTQIEGYEKEFGLDLQPDFQRGRVWPKDLSIKFVEYILRGGRANRTIYFNCPLWQRSLKKKSYGMVIVDGYNRLTSCLDFMSGKLPVFGDNYSHDFMDGFDYIDHCLRFNINDLDTKKEVLKFYLELNEGQISHSKEELDRVRLMLKEEEAKC